MEHYCQLRQMSTRYQAMSQTLPCLYVSEMWYRFDGYLQILSDIILIQYLPLYFRHSRRCITGFEPFLYPSWLYTLAPIPIPFIMPNRLTGAPYLASRSFARLRPAFMLISFVLRTFPISWWLFISLHLLLLLYSRFCCFAIATYLGFVAPSSLHSQLYHTWFYLSSIKFHLFNIFFNGFVKFSFYSTPV